MKFQTIKDNRNRIIIFSLSLLIVLIFSFNFNGINIKRNPGINPNLELTKEDEIDNIDCINLQYTNFQYTSGITSTNSSNIFIFSSLIIGFPLTVEFSIIIKKKNAKRSENFNIEPYPIDLNDSEKLVMNIVQEYLAKNRTCNREAIIRYIIPRFANLDVNFSKLGINLLLESLFSMKLIVDGSKLLRSDVLRNPNRKDIYNHILNNPGIHFMEIVRNVKLSNYLVKWHLDMLLKFNFIKKEKIENFDAYFSINFSSQDNEITHFLARSKSKEILNFLSNNEGSTKYQLSKELGMHHSTISKYISKFEEFGILFGRKYSNKVLYFVNADFSNPELK